MIDVNTFFDLIGNGPPRLYHLKKGRVAQVIDADFGASLQAIFGLNPLFLAEIVLLHHGKNRIH